MAGTYRSILGTTSGARSSYPWLLPCAAGVLLACGGWLAEPAPQVETAALHDAQGDAVIATLHTKDSELRVLSSGGRVRYSLLDAEGVGKSLTLDELQSYDPSLYEFVKAATARRGPTLDARIEPRPEPASVAPDRSEADRHIPSIRFER